MNENNKQKSQYDILFEPVQIGPVKTKNRFYQVPHCNGGGYRDPSAAAEMRAVKAQGGWGVVFTEQCEMHETSEITPFIELRLWEDKDIPAITKMADKIKQHGALAGIQLAYSGINGPNLYSREVPLAPSAMPIRTFTNDPVNAKALDKNDIKNLRKWFIKAFQRSKDAGFNLVCLYGAHGFGIFQHFLSRATNQRTDEYGGSLENRARFINEVVSDARDTIGDTMAITIRMSLDEIINDIGFENQEVREFIEMNKNLPDLWDLAHGTWEDCSGTSRFKDEANQQNLVEGIKKLTDKPIVGVGRFTSPDTMVRQIKNNILDLIGCARPSIADPFMPNKIQNGNVEDIRECIGCNICITGDMTMSISRCTQNPTFMEEWRKGWHPEIINQKGKSDNVLVVGSGPAGLEAALALANRGYDVAIAEQKSLIGGRVTNERKLPGLSAWGRVVDYREYQINQKPNVQVYLESKLSETQILEFGFQNVAIATGAKWRNDGVARHHLTPININKNMNVYTPDDVMEQKIPDGDVVIYDDDHYYMGGVIAELCKQNNANVTIITPAAYVSEWTINTLEQQFIHKKLSDMGVNIILNNAVTEINNNSVETKCVFTNKKQNIKCNAVVLVTAQKPIDELWVGLNQRKNEWEDNGIKSIKVFGDAQAPGPIAWATYAGHRYARELDDESLIGKFPFKREVTELSEDANGK